MQIPRSDSNADGAITIVIFAYGLKYDGIGTTALGPTLGAVVLAAAGYWLARHDTGAATGNRPPCPPDPADDVQVR